MPPVMSTMVMPITAIAGMADCFRITAALSTSAKFFTNRLASTTSARKMVVATLRPTRSR
jgi:hypothetical protein